SAKVIPVHERRAYLPRDVARAVLEGFDKHYRLFRDASVRARALFERAAWAQMRELARERIQMYDQRVQEAVAALLARYPEAERDESLWPAIKLAYIGLLHDHSQPECAETFYNSVACQVLHRRHYHNEFIFWRPAVATEHLEGESPTYRCYYPLQDGLRRTLENIAGSFSLRNSWENPRRDLRNVVRALRKRFPRPARAQPDLHMAVGLAKQGKTLFYRDRHYHLRHSTDRFVVAPGIRGMVMLVFTLPSFPYVFKVIRDRFAPPKDTDRATVMGKYRMVKLHD